MTYEQLEEIIKIAEALYPNDAGARWEFLKSKVLPMPFRHNEDGDFETTDGC